MCVSCVCNTEGDGSVSIIIVHMACCIKLLWFPLLSPSHTQPSTLQHYSGYSVMDIGDCLHDLHRTFAMAPVCSQQAIRKKYASQRWEPSEKCTVHTPRSYLQLLNPTLFVQLAQKLLTTSSCMVFVEPHCTCSLLLICSLRNVIFYVLDLNFCRLSLGSWWCPLWKYWKPCPVEIPLTLEWWKSWPLVLNLQARPSIQIQKLVTFKTVFQFNLELNQKFIVFFEHFFANLFLCTNFTDNVFIKLFL